MSEQSPGMDCVYAVLSEIETSIPDTLPRVFEYRLPKKKEAKKKKKNTTKEEDLPIRIKSKDNLQEKSRTVCRYWNIFTQSGCQKGDRCLYLHQKTEHMGHRVRKKKKQKPKVQEPEKEFVSMKEKTHKVNPYKNSVVSMKELDKTIKKVKALYLNQRDVYMENPQQYSEFDPPKDGEMLIFRTRFDFGGASDAYWRLLNTRPFAMIRIHSTEDGKLFAKSQGLLYHFPYRLMRLGNFPRYPRPESAHINQLIALQAKDVELTLFSNIRYDCILRWLHDLKFDSDERMEILSQLAYEHWLELFDIPCLQDCFGTEAIMFCMTKYTDFFLELYEDSEFAKSVLIEIFQRRCDWSLREECIGLFIKQGANIREYNLSESYNGEIESQIKSVKKELKAMHKAIAKCLKKFDGYFSEIHVHIISSFCISYDSMDYDYFR